MRACHIPSDYKIQNGTSKSILKILSNYIPSNLYDRPKMGFSIPLNRWIQSEKLKIRLML